MCEAIVFSLLIVIIEVGTAYDSYCDKPCSHLFKLL